MSAGRPRSRALLAACAALAVAAALLPLADADDPPRLVRLAGRLHPTLVHFPIAVLLLAGATELAGARVRSLRRATGPLLLIGAVTAVAAAAAGSALALEGGFDASTLASHRWLGVGVAVAAALAGALHHAGLRRAHRASLATAVALVVVAGHQGASLTHGADFLTAYLPGAAPRRLANVDSARVYADLVAPVLARRCGACHGDGAAKGGLRVHTPEALFEGGENGPAVVAGEPEESELLRRASLPPGHEEAMPPGSARPLGIGEIELLRWWIANGASTTQRVADVDSVPSSVATVLARLAGPRAAPRVGLYALAAPPADGRVVAALRDAGLGVGPVAQDLALLRVTAVNVRHAFDDARLGALAPVAAQVTWLDLGGTRVTDAGLAALARMPNLTRLSLGGTAIGDDGLRHLAGLARLEHLNLHGTRVSDAGLAALRPLAALRTVYLWGTRVTPEGRAALQSALPNARIFAGVAARAP